MSLDERLVYLLIGCVIGFFLGYMTRTLREIKEELDEVDRIVKKRESNLKDSGWAKTEIMGRVALAAVVLLAAFASFRTQQTSNEVTETQERLDQVVTCVQATLAETLVVVNSRTAYARPTSTSNLELQRAQSRLLEILFYRPPYPESQREAAEQEYLKALQAYIDAASASLANSVDMPYPKASELSMCVDSVKKEE